MSGKNAFNGPWKNIICERLKERNRQNIGIEELIKACKFDFIQ